MMGKNDYKAFNKNKSFGKMVWTLDKGTTTVKNGARDIERILAKKRPGLAGQSFIGIIKGR